MSTSVSTAGAQICSIDPHLLPDRAEAHVTRILYDEPTAGYMNPPCCIPCINGRGYSRINEDSLETNRPCYNCLCCTVHDGISKQYFDTLPFKRSCCSLVYPQFTSYKESCYCCYCFRIAVFWDICFKPIFGEIVCITPFFCECFPRSFCVRCCSCCFMQGVLHSNSFACRMQEAIDKHNVTDFSIYGPREDSFGAPPRPDAVDDLEWHRRVPVRAVVRAEIVARD